MSRRGLTPARWQALEALFAQAADLPPAGRAELLARVGREDPQLGLELESLLAADAGADPTLPDLGARPHAVAEPDDVPDDDAREDAWREGQTLGRYRLLRRLGRGGMSTVFLAVLEDGGVEKQVALKLLRRELASPDVRRRFERERRILAGLEHPHVARWLDAGEAEDGTPFLVMEYVDGLHIDVYCDRHGLSLRERLRLFVAVCAGVQHAHQNLVVHRDLKPANVLVTRDGVPKLLDFGIAKLLNPELMREADLATSATLRLMTTAYASPEQVRGEPVTTASDVYSLGVLLYELVTGSRPLALDGLPASEAGRLICEADPAPPGAVARRARRPRLDRDLDAVILEAVRKQPRQRYASAAQLAEDIERYLEHQPVKARRGGLAGRAAKAARRNPLAAALGAGLVAFALLAGVSARRARLAADEARAERDRAAAVSDFLAELLAHADPTAAGDAVITAPEILETARRRLTTAAGRDPVLEAQLRDAIGVVYNRLGRPEEAARELEQAVALRRRHPEPGSTALAGALSHLAFVRHRQERYDEAEALNREALALRQAAHGRRHLDVAESLHNLAEVLDARGASEEAEALLREALALRRELGGGRGALVAESLGELGGLLSYRGRHDEGAALLEQAIAIRRAADGGDSAEIGTYLDYLGEAALARGDPTGAEAHLREAERIQRRLLGEQHTDYADTLYDLGRVLLARGDARAAEAALRRALDVWLRLHGPRSRQAAAAHDALASALEAQDRWADAAALLRRALAVQREAFAATRPEIVARTALRLGFLLHQLGDQAAAEPLLLEAVARFEPLPGEALNLAASLNDLGLVRLARGDRSGARARFERALSLYRAQLGDDHPWTAKVRGRVEQLAPRAARGGGS
jgi:serine/threonine-protein kinase